MSGLYPIMNYILNSNDYLDIIDNKNNSLIFEFYHLDNFDYIISQLSKLKFITISIILINLKFENIPESIFNLKNILELDLSDNYIKTISPSIVKLSSLRVLSIAYNKFTDFPINICECKNLEDLDISWNKIYCLPKEMCKLQNLKYFRYENGKLKKIPDRLYDLQNYLGKSILSLYNKKFLNKKLIYRLYVLLTKKYVKFNYKIINKLINY